MPVREACQDGCDWREAGEVCEALNGTFAAVHEDETMFEVTVLEKIFPKKVLLDNEESAGRV